MQRYRVPEFFAKHADRYTSAESALQHALELSQGLPLVKPGIKPRSLTQLDNLVLGIAQAHFKQGQYDLRAITNEVRNLHGFELNHRNVIFIISKLKRRGLLDSSSQRLFGSYQRQRQATNGQINTFRHLVREVLYRPRGFKKYMRGAWRDFLTEDEAHSAGVLGLQRAIEKTSHFQGRRFETYAKILIASQIGQAVRGEQRRKKRVSRAELGSRRVERASFIPASNRREATEELLGDLQLLIKHPKALPHHIGVYAFSIAAERGENAALARRIGVNQSALVFQAKQALKMIGEMKNRK